MDEARLTQLLGPESARYAINTVQVWQTVDETHVVISRERLKRLIALGERVRKSDEWSLVHLILEPGDLDPIP